MNQNIIYAACTKNEILSVPMPAGALKHAIELTCNFCKAQLLASATSYSTTVAIARKLGRYVFAACYECADKRLPDDAALLFPVDKDLQDLYDSFDPENN